MGTTDSAAAAVRLLEAGVAALSDVDLEALSDGQQLAVAYAAGQVSYAQVSVVAPVVPDIAPEVLAAGAGKLLAEQAIQLAPGPLRQVAARIRDHFEPDAAERRARQRKEERWLSVARTFDAPSRCRGCRTQTAGSYY